MNKGVKYTFGGANQDIGKDKHPPHFYYEGQHIRIVATDGQTTGDVTNEKGTERVITLPKIEIVGVINPPVQAVNNLATVLELESVNVPVLYNDVYLYDVTVTIVTQPSYGTASVQADNTITYISELDYNVARFDEFTYKIDDGYTNDTATVNINIMEVADVEEPEPEGDRPSVDDNFDGTHYHYILSCCDVTKGVIHVKSTSKKTSYTTVYGIVGRGGIGREGKLAYRTTDFSSSAYTLGASLGTNCPASSFIEDPKDYDSGLQ